MSESLFLRIKSLNVRSMRGVTSAKSVIRVAALHNLREIQAELGVKAATSSASKAAEKVQSYVVSIPGLTQAEAERTANATLVDITKFERNFEATMEGDPTLTVQRRAVIQGTQTSFDQAYYIQQITRSLDFEGGFVMTVTGKNHSTEGNPEV